MKYNFFFLLLVFISCSKIEPRRPIHPKPSTTILKETTKAYNTIKEKEERKIKQLIKQDSLKNYLQSKNGFWYTYLVKKDTLQNLPKPGDTVEFYYNITDLNDNIIYSKEELGVQNYIVDKEDFITGIQKGIKLMKAGETITFVIPFYNAFGVSGDFKKIGINTSIKSTVTLIKINKKNEDH